MAAKNPMSSMAIICSFVSGGSGNTSLPSLMALHCGPMLKFSMKWAGRRKVNGTSLVLMYTSFCCLLSKNGMPVIRSAPLTECRQSASRLGRGIDQVPPLAHFRLRSALDVGLGGEHSVGALQSLLEGARSIKVALDELDAHRRQFIRPGALDISGQSPDPPSRLAQVAADRVPLPAGSAGDENRRVLMVHHRSPELTCDDHVKKGWRRGWLAAIMRQSLFGHSHSWAEAHALLELRNGERGTVRLLHQVRRPPR